MKKVFIGLTSLIVLVVAALVIIATVDFNRLGKDAVYVQITGDGDIEKFTASDGEVMMMYWYKQPAYKEPTTYTLVLTGSGLSLPRLEQESTFNIVIPNIIKVIEYFAFLIFVFIYIFVCVSVHFPARIYFSASSAIAALCRITTPGF